MKRTLVTIASLIFSANAIGGLYKCTVVDGIEVSQTGHATEQGSFYNSVFGKEFYVDRSTGERHSKAVGNSSARKISVLNEGDESNSFRALSEYGPNVKIDYIQINQFEEGDQKTFIFMHPFGVTYTGICELI